jgi:hypothetical protein
VRIAGKERTRQYDLGNGINWQNGRYYTAGGRVRELAKRMAFPVDDCTSMLKQVTPVFYQVLVLVVFSCVVVPQGMFPDKFLLMGCQWVRSTS